MAIKCPACKFESPDGAAWCDFCKEPFKTKKKLTAEEALAMPLRDDEKIPELPKWVKPAALAFLAIVFLLTSVMTFLLMSHTRPPAR